MNKPLWLARLLRIGGVLETAVGLALLLDPDGGARALLHSSLGGAGIVFGRIAGGGLLSLGISCWCARKTPLSPASLGVSWGFLAYNIVASVTLARAGAALASAGFVALGAALLHGALGAAILVALLAQSQTPTTR